MPRYKLTIAYDGTDFCGWQKQEPYAPAPDAPRPPDQVALPDPVRAGTWAADTAQPLPPRDGEPRARVALRTVQHVVERAVREIVREPVVLMGASRTDAGVHARGQVAAFTCSGEDERARSASEGLAGESIGNQPTPKPHFAGRELEEASPTAGPRGLGWPASRGVERLMRAINGRLPDDVQVVAAELAPPDFNPIQGAVEKAYSYTLHVDPPPPRGNATRPIWDRRYVHQIWDDLDVPAMRAAARRIVGEHDFAAFAAAGHGRLTTVRTVFACEVSEYRDRAFASPLHGRSGAPPVVPARRVRIDVSGSGFLYNMVRIIAGTLVEVGRGRMTPDAVSSAIASKDRRNAGPTLPPTGLCLEWVRY